MTTRKKIIDISLPLDHSSVVYPGNPVVEIEEHKGATSVHSKLTLGTHTGTHIDAPRHVFNDGQGIDEMDLDAFYGDCKVLDMTHVIGSVTQADLMGREILKGDRIILKTSNSERGFDAFYDDYVYLDGDCAEYLADIKIALIAIDYFSIKQRGGSDNRPHTAFLEKNIPIIEAVNLKSVDEGSYTLSAFPLRIKNGDGSPARVVLIED